MLIKEFWRKRTDGVDLYRRFDAKVDENGEPLLDDNGQPIPTGYNIRKKGTKELYDVAIDVAGAPYEYEETDIPIEDNKK